mmetsp:Transcript_11913/g.25905  ORF Transcript_11913/g.25905 Transcript_11913/m.25905 type:complete len:275 (+) Transcript_11913:1322-2146(+)
MFCGPGVAGLFAVVIAAVWRTCEERTGIWGGRESRRRRRIVRSGARPPRWCCHCREGPCRPIEIAARMRLWKCDNGGFDEGNSAGEGRWEFPMPAAVDHCRFGEELGRKEDVSIVVEFVAWSCPCGVWMIWQWMVGRNWRVGNWCDFVVVVALLHRGLLLVLLAEAPTTTTTTEKKGNPKPPIYCHCHLCHGPHLPKTTTTSTAPPAAISHESQSRAWHFRVPPRHRHRHRHRRRRNVRDCHHHRLLCHRHGRAHRPPQKKPPRRTHGLRGRDG